MKRLQTINEDIALVIDFSQAPNECEYCGEPAQLRPYGKDGAWICFKCGMEHEDETEANFADVLDGSGSDAVKIISVRESMNIQTKKVKAEDFKVGDYPPMTKSIVNRAVAVDFDSTIHSYESGFSDDHFDPPVSGAIEAVSKLCDKFEEVFIFTARTELAGVELWLKYQFKEADIPYPNNLTVTNNKPIADIYIDDRGYKFMGDWDKTLQDVEEYKTWVSEHRLSTIRESLCAGKYPTERKATVAH